MKKLSIEQKAKAYDEALKRADRVSKGKADDREPGITICKYIFPELKTSKYESIRNGLIALLEFGLENGSTIAPGFNVTKEQALAWLEEQKNTQYKEYVFRPVAGCDISDAATQAIEQQQLGYKIVLAFNGAYIPVEEKTVNDIVNEYYSWIKKQAEPNPYSGVSFKYNGHAWGMCARDNGIEIVMDGKPIQQFSYKDCEQKLGGKSALEAIKKEQVDNQNCVKPADKVEPKFKPGDTMRTWREAANGYTDGMPVVVSIDDEYYHCTNELIAIKDQDNYEFPPINVKHNTVDKVGPKFHPGEWITHNTANFVFKIINVGSNGYEVVNRENYKKIISFDNEDNYHLWSRKDAKCGDVLISSLYKQPFVYNGNYTCDTLGGYFGLNSQGELLICDSNDNHNNNWTKLTGVQPATKEQRNMLFKKLHDSDYKWDSENKELWHKYL